MLKLACSVYVTNLSRFSLTSLGLSYTRPDVSTEDVRKGKKDYGGKDLRKG